MNRIVYARNGIPEHWMLRNRNKVVHLNPYAKFYVNDYWMAKFFTVEGSAVGYLPDVFVNFEIRQRSLVPVFPEWRSESVPILPSGTRHLVSYCVSDCTRSTISCSSNLSL